MGPDESVDELSADKGRFRHLFDNVQDAVVEFEIVDGSPVVRHVNPAFVDVFGYEPESIVGESLNDFIVPDRFSDEATSFDDRTDAGQHNKAAVRRETSDGLRRFLYRGVPYEGWDGTARGFAIYSDITDQTRREHRLQVLHRVMRHNLRNEVNVVSACAELLALEVDDDRLSELVAEIEARTDKLEHLSDEAGRVHRLLDSPESERRAIGVRRTFEQVVEEASRQHPAAEFEVRAPETLVVTATEHLQGALAELVDNAVRHNDSASPTVRLSATLAGTDGWVDLEVADDGPEIPRTERRTATGKREPTQLDHGSGLGLLLVRWITDTSGGTVEIERSDLGGNVVRLRLKGRTSCE